MNSSAAVAPGLANGHAPHRPASDPSPVLIPGPTSPQSSMIASGQQYLLFPSFTLESGITLTNLPVAFKTWGKLDEKKKDNALVVAHALTGSADVEDWWGPLLGPGKLFDPTRYFIFCANVLGSPYGSGGPCTRKGGEDYDFQSATHHREKDWDGNGWWGPEFPATTVRDDVRIQKLVLDFLGVEHIAAVVGGSMGGMAVLEWPLCFPVRFPPTDDPCQIDVPSSLISSPQDRYISCIIPIATAARHGAWCISWAEAQRQSIYSDPLFLHGYYPPDAPPRAGLAAARMAALLTYRSRDSFESRFGRRVGAAAKGGGAVAAAAAAARAKETKETVQEHNPSSITPPRRSSTAEEAALAHNEGNLSPRPSVPDEGKTGKNGNHLESSHESGRVNDAKSSLPAPEVAAVPATSSIAPRGSSYPPPVFSAQSYLRYQGDKFVKRFDANCYVHLTRKMDTHDLARGRVHWGFLDPKEAAREAKEAQEEAASRVGSSQEVLQGEKRLPHAGEEDDEALARVLTYLGTPDDPRQRLTRYGALPPTVHVVSISSDGLFQTPEQRLIHQLIPGSTFHEVPSPEGHDGFLLEFEAIGSGCEDVLKRVVGEDFYRGDGVGWEEWKDWGSDGMGAGGSEGVGKLGVGGEKMPAVKESVFGEVEDLTRW